MQVFQILCLAELLMNGNSAGAVLVSHSFLDLFVLFSSSFDNDLSLV